MTAPATVPVIVTPEAAARLDELGMHKELEQMIEHTRQTVAGLVRIEVVLAERYDTGGEPGITIEAYTNRPYDPADRTEWDWGTWKVTTFPPHVCEHFVMMILYETSHAG